MKKVEAEDILNKWNTLFTPYKNIPMWIRFNNHAAQVIIQDITIPATSKMKNMPVPEKRLNEDGKRYTPSLIQLTCDSCRLYFVIEDYTIAAIMKGIELSSPGVSITITKD